MPDNSTLLNAITAILRESDGGGAIDPVADALERHAREGIDLREALVDVLIGEIGVYADVVDPKNGDMIPEDCREAKAMLVKDLHGIRSLVQILRDLRATK